jgi:betaine lipid synthase
MIVQDYMERNALTASQRKGVAGGNAIWEYIVDTFDPAVRDTLLSSENYFYYLCLNGKYSKECAPRYLGRKAHEKLNKKGAFDGVRIHTDALMEVVARMRGGSVTIVVLMDSMDWFDPAGTEEQGQVQGLWRVLSKGGRVLLRSASLKPWYIGVFETEGFRAECVGRRVGGRCIDRLV